ncbi:MAG: SpoIIE family protein phosphatase [Bacteroidales bacterium]|nr:SpoIIE family protein phosphatase [Bacteroidales bacterium]
MLRIPTTCLWLLLSLYFLNPTAVEANSLSTNTNQQGLINENNSQNEKVSLEELSDKKEFDDILKEKENEIELMRKQLKLQKRNLILLFIITFLFMVTIVIALCDLTCRKRANQLLTAQKLEAQEQKSTSDKKARSFTESLNYAQRIQKAILRNSLHILGVLPDSFILLYPKDIVSGDFYWIQEKNNRILFALADCTGHGVPGALMSIIGTYGLNRVVNELNITSPGEVLHNVNHLFEDSLKQRSSSDIFDGMDIALCSYNPKSMELKYSGANLPLLICRSNTQPHPSNVILRKGKTHTLYSMKPTKQAIGSFSENKAFANHSIVLEKDDVIYLYSDGYTDQFGGPDGRKFKSQPLYQLLVSICSLPIDDQKQIVESTFMKWKGNAQQVDDVSFIGIKI